MTKTILQYIYTNSFLWYIIHIWRKIQTTTTQQRHQHQRNSKYNNNRNAMNLNIHNNYNTKYYNNSTRYAVRR